jgi:hypothetical protein
MSLGIDDFLLEQVAPIKAKITAYNAAITGLATGGILSYEIESGQTRHKVTRNNISVLEDAVSGLMNQLTTLEARLCGNGSVHYGPSW